MTTIADFRNVAFSYEANDEVGYALVDVSFSIKKGEWVAIIGHNGSGKSTIAKLMNGLIFPTSGEVRMFDMEMSEQTIWDIRSNIGMVFQNPDNQFVGATVQDDVAFALENYGVPFEEMLTRVHDSLKQVRMDRFINNEPHHLSGGQKQRVAIAGALALHPKLILLDEATAMLDPKGRQEVIQTLKKLRETTSITVISITHDLEEALLADRIIWMNKGEKHMEGKPTEVFKKVEEIQQLGLDLPFPMKMDHLLRQRGINLPEQAMSEEQLVEYLWTYNFKK